MIAENSPAIASLFLLLSGMCCKEYNAAIINLACYHMNTAVVSSQDVL
jgi:hypothetical protein